MQPKSRKKFPKQFAAALSLLILFELLYLSFFSKRLEHLFVFRFHLPGLFFFVVILVTTGISYYEYHGFGSQEGIVRRGHAHPYVALTFDDGPNPLYTPQILDILKEKQAPAAFFMVGKHIEKYPQVARRVFAEGHDIGNHTYSHRDLIPATKKTVEKEINKTDQAIIQVIGVRTKLFRPPRGIISNTVRALLVEMGYTITLWTISALDWRGLSPKAMIKRVMRHVHAGEVILFHDSGALIRSEGADRGNTVDALPMIIDELRRRGFEIVLLSRMIKELDHIPAENFIEVLTPQSLGQET